MKILTNAPGLPAKWTACNGEQGETVVFDSFGQGRAMLRESDLLLINSDPDLLFKFCALKYFDPLKRPILGSDIILRKPEGIGSKIVNVPKKMLLARVDHFMHPFRDISGYRKYFGIEVDRSSFLPFKPNLRYHCDIEPNPDGEYVLCVGWSLRDYDTFFSAIERLPYPAAIPTPDFAQLRRHGSRFSRSVDRLPSNLKLVQHDPKSYDSQAELIRGAKVVVVPLLRKCLVQAGTPYNAMLLGKCVILTAGPAINGLFKEGEVLPVPAEDADALAAAIEQAWNDDALRARVAEAGYKHTMQLGGEPELAQRMIDQAVRWYRGIPTPPELTCFTLDDASQS